MKLRVIFALILVSLLSLLAQPLGARAAPVAPVLSIRVKPTELRPAQAGYVFISGGFPLEVSATLDGTSMETFWAGDGYVGLFSFGFDEPPGSHTLVVQAADPATGEHIEQSATIIVARYAYPLEQVALPNKLSPLLAQELNDAEVAKLNAIYAARTPLPRLGWPLGLPVVGGIVTSRFGGNRTYNGGLFAAHHAGIDFRRTTGEPVEAAASGRVAAAEFFEVRGNVVILDHGHGFFTQYAHLSEVYVEVGQTVQQGQIIGAAGGTGRANGPHLHWEVIVNGYAIDPLTWLALFPNFVPPREVTPQDPSTGP